MEYLPKDPNMEVPSYVEKKEEKLKEYRKYLVDKDVVLSITKYLLALRNAETKPADPVSYLQEYFGKYRDPAWDELDKLKEDNKKLEDTLPILNAKVAELEKMLEQEKTMGSIKAVFQKFEKDKSECVTMKTLYKALCGGQKFDVTTALNANQFKEFVKSLVPDAELEALKEKIGIFEKAAQGEAPFAGALDNPTFVTIVEAMRKFKPEVDPKEAAGKDPKEAKKA